MVVPVVLSGGNLTDVAAWILPVGLPHEPQSELDNDIKMKVEVLFSIHHQQQHECRQSYWKVRQVNEIPPSAEQLQNRSPIQ